MSGFLSIPAEELDNVTEPSVVAAETECLLRVTDLKHANNKNNDPYVLIRFAFVEYEDAKTFTKYFGLPHDRMTKDDRNSAIRRLKYFYQAFDIDYSSGEVSLEMVIGAEGWAMVGIDQQEGSEFGPQNFIKRFIVPGN